MISEVEPKSSIEDKPVTVLALAERWGCSPKFVYSEIHSGALTAWKLGGKLFRIRQSAIEDYERSQTIAVDSVVNLAAPENIVDSPMLTVTDLANRWECSSTFIYDLIERREIEAVKLGSKSIRIFEQAVEEYECRNHTVSVSLAAEDQMELATGPTLSIGGAPTADVSAYRLARQIRRRHQP